MRTRATSVEGPRASFVVDRADFVSARDGATRRRLSPHSARARSHRATRPAPTPRSPGASHPRPGEPSDLEFAKAYLPYVRDAKKVGFLATLPDTNFYDWTLRENCRCAVRAHVPELDPFQSREQYRSATVAWLVHTPLDLIVVIDAPSYAVAEFGKTYETLLGQIDAIKQDSRFQSVATVPVPAVGATITIFRPRA